MTSLTNTLPGPITRLYVCLIPRQLPTVDHDIALFDVLPGLKKPSAELLGGEGYIHTISS